jgi:hypothetical protein
LRTQVQFFIRAWEHEGCILVAVVLANLVFITPCIYSLPFILKCHYHDNLIK